MSGRHEVDVVVIGLGVGGEFLSTRLAEGGCSVVGIEAHLVGGECPYYGCVPTKMIVRAVSAVEPVLRQPILGHGREVGEVRITAGFRAILR